MNFPVSAPLHSGMVTLKNAFRKQLVGNNDAC